MRTVGDPENFRGVGCVGGAVPGTADSSAEIVVPPGKSSAISGSRTASVRCSHSLIPKIRGGFPAPLEGFFRDPTRSIEVFLDAMTPILITGNYRLCSLLHLKRLRPNW